MNYLDSIQRREAIDEDKKIHKRALDSEFAFLKRIGEDTLPIKKLDQRALFNISKMIEDCAVELDGISVELSTFINPISYWTPEQGEFTGQTYLYLEFGKVVKYWNILVSYIKNFLNSNTLSPKEVNDIWDLIDERIGKNVYEIQSMVNYLEFDETIPEGIELKFPERSDLNQLYDFIEYKNLSPIITSTSEGFIRSVMGKAFETPEQALLNRQTREQAEAREQGHQARQAIERFRPELAHGLERRARTMERMRQAEREQGLPEGFIEPLGLGLGKPKRKSKKKMDTDEFEINIECHNKNMTTKQLKEMKKALKKMPLPFDDGDDSNYLK